MTPKTVFRQAILLLAVALVPALVSALVHPGKPDWHEAQEAEIPLAAAEVWKARVLWVDARSRMEYERDHIPGAVLLNEDDWGGLVPGILAEWSPERVIVVYCSTQRCRSSHAVAHRLKEQVGLGSVYVLKGGWEAWLAAGKR